MDERAQGVLFLEDRREPVKRMNVGEVDEAEKPDLRADAPIPTDESAAAEGGEVFEFLSHVPRVQHVDDVL